MTMRKFGAPATSHVRLITAEDVADTDAAMLKDASRELSQTNPEKKKNEQESKTDDSSDSGGH